MEENARNVAYNCVIRSQNPLKADTSELEKGIQLCMSTILEAWNSENIPFQNSQINLSAHSLTHIQHDSVDKNQNQDKRHAEKEDAWTKIEAQFLTSSMINYPDWGFEKIAQEMYKITGKLRTRQSVHLRWFRVQNPNLKKGRWEPQEEMRLRQLFAIHQGDLRKITTEFKSRNIVQITKHMKVMNLIQ